MVPLPASRVRVTPAGLPFQLVAAAVLLAGAVAGCRSVPLPSSARPDLSAPRPVSIAVVPLANHTGDTALSWLGPGLQETITWDLRRSRAARVVELEELVQITGRLPSDLAGLAPADLIAAGRALGADYVVFGGYTGTADALTVELFAASSARSGAVRVERSGATPASVAAAARNALSRIGDTLRFAPPPARERDAGRASAPTGRAIAHLAHAALGGGRLALDDAIAQLEDAVRADAERPEVHLRLGHALARLNAYDRALTALARSRALAHRRDDPAVEVRSLNEMGRVALDKGNAGDAERHHRDALAIASATGDWQAAAAAVRGIGIAHYFRAEYDLAGARFDEAIGIARWLGDRRTQAALLANLADVKMAPGDYAETRTQLQEALAMARAVRDPYTESWALNDLGFVALRLGNYREAEAAFEGTLRLATARGDRRAEGLALKNRGRVALGKGALAAAERFLSDARAVLRAIGAAVLEIDTIDALATVRFRQRDYEAARATWDEGLALSRSLRLPLFETQILHGLAQVALARDALDDGRRLHQESLDVARRVRARRAEAAALYGVGEAERRRGQSANADRAFGEAVALAERMGVREIEWRARYGRGDIREAAGRDAEAVEEYRRAVAVITALAQQFGETEERQAFLDDKFAAYDALARVLLKLHIREPARGHATEAWAVLEAKKGRLVAEALRGATATLDDVRIRGPIEQIEAKRARVEASERAVMRALAATDGERGGAVARLTRTLATEKDSYLQAVDGFLARYPEYKTLFVDQQSVDLRDLASFSEDIPPGTVALQYYAARETLYIFIVTQGTHRVKTHAVPREELYDLIRGYREYVMRPSRGALGWTDDGSEAYRTHVRPLRSLTGALSRHLIAPVAGELAEFRNVVFMPNDLLFSVPMHALTLDRPNEAPRFLAETHSVSYLTRRHLADIDRPTAASADRSLLAIGNPDDTLPGASQEVRALEAIRRTNVKVLVGADATKAAFKALARQFGDLHLATHGVLDPERPGDSHLVMAGEGREPGRLDVREISGLRLRNALAVLSACDTAVGEQTPGAALITLAGAFSQAGARSIVASLWPVSDQPTRDFMVTFHTALLTSGRADALQAAQRTLIAVPATAHPFYWASFILLGRR